MAPIPISSWPASSSSRTLFIFPWLSSTMVSIALLPKAFSGPFSSSSSRQPRFHFSRKERAKHVHNTSLLSILVFTVLSALSYIHACDLTLLFSKNPHIPLSSSPATSSRIHSIHGLRFCAYAGLLYVSSSSDSVARIHLVYQLLPIYVHIPVSNISIRTLQLKPIYKPHQILSVRHTV